MTSNTWYQSWFSSPYYQKLSVERHDRLRQALFTSFLPTLNPVPGARIIDLACGTGTITKMLADKDLDVTGIDSNEKNISEALKNEGESLHFYLHDIRLPFWGNYFDIALLPAGSFGYYRTRRENNDALRTIANSLRPGGLLIIDYLNAQFAENHLPPSEVKMIDEVTYTMHHSHNETHFFNALSVTGPSLPETLTVTEEWNKFSLYDITEMLGLQSLQVQNVYGDHAGTGYDERKSERMIVIGKKGVGF